ncbi:hypothetical protein GJ496_011354, partial [Pomphorhynchus laevis]
DSLGYDRQLLQKNEIKTDDDVETDVYVRLSSISDRAAPLFTPSVSTSQIPSSTNVRFLAGVISARKLSAFELTIWRTSRGNAFLRQSPIKEEVEDPMTGEVVTKVVFLVFFQGDKLREKIKKICDGFLANLYSCPDNVTNIQRCIEDVTIRQIDLTRVLSSANEHRNNLLIGAAEQINSRFIQVLKTKAIYHVLNMCRSDVAKQSLLAECWIPANELGFVEMALKAGTKESGGDVTAILNRKATEVSPPTNFEGNKLTNAFQSLVDAYGVADYQEMNPVPFSIISFPFLFALMFGDFGHALILSLMGIWMCADERRLAKKWRSNEMWHIIFSGRYIILLMGLFSIYTGFMYNDAISKSIDIFGSQWRVAFDFTYMSTHSSIQLQPDPFNRANQTSWVKMYSGYPYIFGIDPIWAMSLNKITYLNSLKMKLSIIIGVVQMILGLFLHLSNILYFNRKIDIFFDFLPKIIFFICMFVYLVILIFYKWIRYNGSADSVYGSFCAPSLLVQYINMFLFSYGSTECSLSPFYPGQKQFQTMLVLIGISCVPFMLIPKPVIQIQSMKKHRKIVRNDSLSASLIDMVADTVPLHQSTNDDIAYDDADDSKATDKQELSIGDIIMDHTIETIEFFLNSISSAASYLRLWALSLAHAELAEVLWKMLFHMGYVMSDQTIIKGILIFVLFHAWALLTVSILVCMEGLSAFLHCLRLHWVEFQSKFYKGTGYSFTPLRLKSIAERVNFK